MKILFLITEDWAFISHRLHLAKYAKKMGHKVAVLCKINNGCSEINSTEINLYSWNISRKSYNIFREFRTIRDTQNTLNDFSPDIIHAVGLKPVIYSFVASILTGSRNRVLALGGLGYLFSSKSLKAFFLLPFIKLAYKISFSFRNTILILQNNDDKKIILENQLINKSRIRIIKGAGVEENKFVPTLENEKDLKVLFPARMLWDKGIMEFVEIARKIKILNIDVTFILSGARDTHNPECVPLEKINEWVEDGLVEWLGHCENMSKIYSDVNIVCLPSYREGLPKSLLEACSCSRPVVAFDVPGCREVVVDGFNGFLVPFGDVEKMFQRVLQLLKSSALRKKMGLNGRKKILNEFSSASINKEVVNVWKELYSRN